METIYHPGELKVQEQVGVREEAARLGRTIYPVIAHIFVDFIQGQPLAVLGGADNQGRSWASILSGEPGFMRVADEQTLRIAARPAVGDPLNEALRDGSELGLLLIDFATRRRLRLNGSVTMESEGFSVHARQVYANCPRYIQARTCQWRREALPVRTVAGAGTLSTDQQQRIRRADTFFVASMHPDCGADASHRGGFPGFVQVPDGQTLIWPEYNGNSMFNTLGNICENPHVGLLFLDFEHGGTLQLSGTAKIIWDRDRAAALPGAERLVELHIDRIIETENAMALRCSFQGYSPDNPWFC